MRDVVTIAKALSDENRVRILAILEGRDLCVCQVIELLGLAPSTVSTHLSILKHARLIDGRKHGRWMYYRLAGEMCPRSPKMPSAGRLMPSDATSSERKMPSACSRFSPSIRRCYA
jgi:hypothetical protein